MNVEDLPLLAKEQSYLVKATIAKRGNPKDLKLMIKEQYYVRKFVVRRIDIEYLPLMLKDKDLRIVNIARRRLDRELPREGEVYTRFDIR